MRVFCLHNPRAGSGHPSRELLEQLMREAGHELVYRSADDPSWRAVEFDRIDLCVAAGGDGTVGKLARKLAGRNMPIAVLPLGTANNIATALGISSAPLDQLIDGWRHASRRPLDLGVATGPWGRAVFLESVGVGLLAECMSRIESGQTVDVDAVEDPEAQLAAARDVCLGILRTLTPAPAELTTPGRRSEMRYLLLEVMNCGAAGPRLQLAAAADPHDGLLDVVAILDHQRQELIDLISRTSPATARAVGAQQVAGLTLEVEAAVVHIDDRVWKPDAPGGRVRVELEAQPGALTVLVPADAVQPGSMAARALAGDGT